MKQTDLFFSCVVDLRYHSFAGPIRDAMYVVYDACKAINQPNKYGPTLDVIHVDAILQDHPSRFFKPDFVYAPKRKTLEAGVKVDMEQIARSDFQEIVAIFRDVIFGVLDRAAERVEDYDFAGLKRDLEEGIREELGTGTISN